MLYDRGMFFDLPMEIQRKIFEFDPTYVVHYKKVMCELKTMKYFFDTYIRVDRGFTIRNWLAENWVIVPRYYDVERKRINGSYIRRWWRVTEPL